MRIPVQRLTAFTEWSSAPLGALLEIRGHDGQSGIAMRCRLALQSQTIDALLILNGSDRGMLVEGGVRLPAIDVSDLFDIVVADPAPIELGAQHHEMRGLVCACLPGRGRLVVRARLRSAQRVYVWIRDDVRSAFTYG